MNLRVELYHAQVQLVYNSNLNIVFMFKLFTNKIKSELIFFRIKYRTFHERIDSLPS